MFSLLIVFIIIASIVMIAVVLLQPGKGDLTATFGGLGGQMGSMFGMQRTKDIMSRITQIVAAIIFVLALLVNRFVVGSTHSAQAPVVKPITEGAKAPASNMTPPPVQNAPANSPAPKR